MNLKNSIVLMSTLALVVLFSTAMISRDADTPAKKTNKVLTDKEKKVRWSQKGHKLVWERLTKPLAKKYKVNLKRQMISRCPSGLQYNLKDYKVAKGKYFYGEMRKQSGCSRGTLICKFRVNQKQSVLEVFNKKTKQFTNHNQWLMAHNGPQKIKQNIARR